MRTTGDPLAAVPFLRKAVAEARPGASVATVMTMDARLSSAVAEPRFFAVLVGCFAALAFLLAAFGLYGVLSHTVAQRRGEIAIRMALGAWRADVLALVVRQGAALVATGTVVGLAAAAASSRVLESFLYGIATDDRLDLRGGAARPGGRGARRLLRPGEAGDSGRTDGGPTLRIARPSTSWTGSMLAPRLGGVVASDPRGGWCGSPGRPRGRDESGAAPLI